MRLGQRQGLWWGWQTTDHLLPSHITLFQSILAPSHEHFITFYCFCYPGEIRDGGSDLLWYNQTRFYPQINSDKWIDQLGSGKKLFIPASASSRPQISISPLLQASEAGGGWILWLKGILGKNIWYLGFWVLKLLNGPLDSMLHCTTYKSSCLWYHHASSHIIHNVDWALDILILDWWLYDN